MQRSFSVIEDEDIFTLDAEDIIKKDKEIRDVLKKENVCDLELSDSEEHSISPKRASEADVIDSSQITSNTNQSSQRLSQREQVSRIPSAVLSGRRTVLKKRPSNNEKLAHVSSDSEDSEVEEKKFVIPNGYDPTLYEHLEVDDETKDIFQYILKYTPQQLNLDFKFKPFIPEFLPAVGDIDAFLKVVSPDRTVNGDKFDEKSLNLGLTVLDEPALNQSDPALLHLQLRAASVNPPNKKHGSNMVVKTVDNLEKNSKVIDKWIKDISDLHKSKSSPVVRYSEPMPDLDDLMQQWPEEVETKLKETGFPKQGDMSLSEYVDTVCNLFQIPIAKKKVQSLHLLFCLYAAIKQTQLYQTTTANNDKAAGYQSNKKEADQLVLD